MKRMNVFLLVIFMAFIAAAFASIPISAKQTTTPIATSAVSKATVDTAILEQTAKSYLESLNYEIYSVKIGHDMVIEYGITQQMEDRMMEALNKPLGEGEAPFQAFGDMLWNMMETYALTVEQMPELGNLRMRFTGKDGSITEFVCLKEDLNMESNSLMYKVLGSGSYVQA